MHTGGEAGRSWATAGILDLAILLTTLALLLLATTVKDQFQSLYGAIGSGLPILTGYAFVPGLGIWIAGGCLGVALLLNVGLRRRMHVLVPGLALLLALSAGAIAVFMFALVLPLMKLSVTLKP